MVEKRREGRGVRSGAPRAHECRQPARPRLVEGGREDILRDTATETTAVGRECLPTEASRDQKRTSHSRNASSRSNRQCAPVDRASRCRSTVRTAPFPRKVSAGPPGRVHTGSECPNQQRPRQAGSTLLRGRRYRTEPNASTGSIASRVTCNPRWFEHSRYIDVRIGRIVTNTPIPRLYVRRIEGPAGAADHSPPHERPLGSRPCQDWRWRT